MNSSHSDDAYARRLIEAALEHNPDGTIRLLITMLEEQILEAKCKVDATVILVYYAMCSTDPDYAPLDPFALLRVSAGGAR